MGREHNFFNFPYFYPCNFESYSRVRSYRAKANAKREIFLWSLQLLNVSSKWDFLVIHLEAISLSRSLSLSVNEPLAFCEVGTLFNLERKTVYTKTLVIILKWAIATYLLWNIKSVETLLAVWVQLQRVPYNEQFLLPLLVPCNRDQV